MGYWGVQTQKTLDGGTLLVKEESQSGSLEMDHIDFLQPLTPMGPGGQRARVDEALGI